MALIFPGDCITPAERVEYCYRALQDTQDLHNKVGAWRRGELLETDYLTLPPGIQTRYPWQTPSLPGALWDDFTINVFDVLQNAITEQLAINRALLESSSRWSVDLEVIHGGL